MVKITETSALSAYEKQKFKKEEDFLMIGKSDKSINVVSMGELIAIKELATANRTGTLTGTLTIPTAEGVPFVIQYGIVQATSPDQTLEVPFITPFTNRAFSVQVTQTNGGTHLATSARPTITDATKFTLAVTGGGNDYFSWFAIGF